MSCSPVAEGWTEELHRPSRPQPPPTADDEPAVATSSSNPHHQKKKRSHHTSSSSRGDKTQGDTALKDTLLTEPTASEDSAMKKERHGQYGREAKNLTETETRKAKKVTETESKEAKKLAEPESKSVRKQQETRGAGEAVERKISPEGGERERQRGGEVSPEGVGGRESVRGHTPGLEVTLEKLMSSLTRKRASTGRPEALQVYLHAFSLYRIALIFCRSKFSRITALKEFVENISQMCVAHVCDSTLAQILV